MSSRRDFIKTAGTLAVASAIPAMGGAQAALAAVQAVFFQFFPVFKHISHRLFAFFQITVFSALSLS